jgi:hypothetical protein
VTSGDIRNWLGIYVLVLVAFLGGYAFLAPDYLLPLESGDRVAAFEIILPVLLAQVALVFRFYTDEQANTRAIPRMLPAWVVKLPLLLVTLLIGIELAMSGIAGVTRQKPPSPEAFKGLITFCVSLLNVSSIVILSKYFDAGTTGTAHKDEPGERKPY